MNINFNKNSIGHTNNVKQTRASFNLAPFVTFKNQPDKFIKTNQISDVSLDLQSTQRLFDETYLEVMKQNLKLNPELQRIDFYKPIVKIIDTPDDTLACYSLNDNTVEVNPDLLNEDFYVLGLKNHSGELSKVFNVFPKKKIDSVMPSLSRKYPNLTLIKLSPKEKELYIKAIFAHELRHFVQGHLMLSTKGVNTQVVDSYRAKKEKVETEMAEYNQILSEMDEKDKQDRKPIELAGKFDYVLNYKPKELLDENTTIKYSLLSSDRRYLSVKDNFLLSELRGINGFGRQKDSAREEYMSSSLETDAYNYEKEYFISKMSEYENSCRSSVLNSIYIQFAKNASEAELAMKNSGMSFIEN